MAIRSLLASLTLVIGACCLPCESLGQYGRAHKESPEQLKHEQMLSEIWMTAQRVRLDARHLLDQRSTDAKVKFFEAADIFTSMGDRRQAALTEAELRFEQGDYQSVERFLTSVFKPSDFDADPFLWLAISNCERKDLVHAESYIKLFLSPGHIETGLQMEDVPGTQKRSLGSYEATAWLILGTHKESAGRPCLTSYLNAQRLQPQNALIAARLAEVYLARQEFALALKNVLLMKTAKSQFLKDRAEVLRQTTMRRQELAAAGKSGD